MNNAKTSIIMPTYNREALIGESITSIIKQEHTNWECIIIDDNSTDRSLEKIAELVGEDERFIIIKKDKTIAQGAQQSRNLGLQRATGRYVLFLDSDDLLSPTCLTQRISFMEQRPDTTLGIFPGLRFKKEPYDTLTIISTYQGKDPIKAFLECNTPWTILNGIWRRKELLRNNVFFDEKVKGFQDIDFHLQALFKGMTHAFADNEPDCFWRLQQYDNIGNHLVDESFVNSHAYLIKKVISNVENLKDGNKRYGASMRKFIFYKLRMQLVERKFNSFEILFRKMISTGYLTKTSVIIVRLLANLCKINSCHSPLINKLIFMFYKMLLLGTLPFCRPNKHFLVHQYSR
ncbi:MAG: glycosyltransferase family 2 protein [Desulfobulbaceae bacterium]|nr:glycosyltransferase family 2 protein [Desulfobulbaceae bacterium]